MREEIIITTEKVKLSEMSDRERKIYDTGFADGVKSEQSEKSYMQFKTIALAWLLVTFIVLCYLIKNP